MYFLDGGLGFHDPRHGFHDLPHLGGGWCDEWTSRRDEAGTSLMCETIFEFDMFILKEN